MILAGLMGLVRVMGMPCSLACLAPQAVRLTWPFQWIESGWLVALSLILIAATIWLVRRRAA